MLGRLALVACILIMCAGCVERRAPECLLPEGVELRAGDVVLRRGGGLTSRAVIMADGGGMYSHVGIVADSAGVPMIVHAVPGEPDFEGDPDRVKMERPERFFSSLMTNNGCVMRPADAALAKRAAAVALGVYRRRALFDHDYNELDTVKMYCCELVEHAYARAGRGVVEAPRHRPNIPGFIVDSVMLPSDFRGSSRLRVVAEF